MKTYQDLLNYFQDRPEIAAKIEANTTPNAKKIAKGDRLHNVLNGLFRWTRTEEGYSYWDKIYKEVKEKNP